MESINARLSSHFKKYDCPFDGLFQCEETFCVNKYPAIILSVNLGSVWMRESSLQPIAIPSTQAKCIAYRLKLFSVSKDVQKFALIKSLTAVFN